MGKDLFARIVAMATAMRKDVLRMALDCGAPSHIGGSLSEIEILAVLYGAVLNLNGDDSEKDVFILSKGHTALGYYAALCEAGIMPRDDMTLFQKSGEAISAEATMNPSLGIVVSTGSLGMGLPFGVGLALARKSKGAKGRVFVLLGNGECNEGSVWEAIMTAAHYKLNNIVAIVDNNKFQSDGKSENILDMGRFKDKFEAFGWRATDVDGHDVEELYRAFVEPAEFEKPSAIIAATVKGKGIAFMEDKAEWHHGRLSEKLYGEAMEGLS